MFQVFVYFTRMLKAQASSISNYIYRKSTIPFQLNLIKLKAKKLNTVNLNQSIIKLQSHSIMH